MYIFTDSWLLVGGGVKGWNDMFSCLNSLEQRPGWFTVSSLACPFFPTITPSYSFPAFTNSVWLFSKMPRCRIRERSVHTEDRLCEPWTHKVYSVSCHYDTDSKGGGGGSPALFHPQCTWLMATWAPHSDLNPHRSLLPAVGAWGPSSGPP